MLSEVVNSFNNSGRGKAALQEFNADTGKSFILCIVTELMCCVHEKVRQAGELYYMDASSSFEHFNNSIILFYTSCAISALPLGLFITSDEFEVTLEKAINLLKSILPPLSPPSATRRSHHDNSSSRFLPKYDSARYESLYFIHFIILVIILNSP
ncbi:unnamed protein product [Rhizophagus irregularis]|nr:unnamed protein product [Rhizophagus irregularis]